jgi:hypothetical protein
MASILSQDEIDSLLEVVEEDIDDEDYILEIELYRFYKGKHSCFGSCAPYVVIRKITEIELHSIPIKVIVYSPLEDSSIVKIDTEASFIGKFDALPNWLKMFEGDL